VVWEDAWTTQKIQTMFCDVSNYYALLCVSWVCGLCFDLDFLFLRERHEVDQLHHLLDSQVSHIWCWRLPWGTALLLTREGSDCVLQCPCFVNCWRRTLGGNQVQIGVIRLDLARSICFACPTFCLDTCMLHPGRISDIGGLACKGRVVRQFARLQCSSVNLLVHLRYIYYGVPYWERGRLICSGTSRDFSLDIH